MANGLRGRLALLALAFLAARLAQVESPALYYRCGDGEYGHSGICCKNCPAGTHVDEHCYMPHTLGHCVDCTEGEDYTAHGNGLESCLPCKECKPGTTMVKPCSVKADTECRCKDGYYCPPGCEECLKCKTKCPEGQVVVQNCNATADMKCGPPPTGASPTDDVLILYIVPFGIIGTIGIIVVVIGIFCKCCAPWRTEEKKVNDHLSTDSTDDLLQSWKNPNTDAVLTENQQVYPSLADPASVPRSSDLAGSVNLPLSHTEETSSSVAAPLLQSTDRPVTHNIQSNVLPSNTERPAMIKPSLDELSKICEELPDKVLIREWNPLMRNAGLSNNDIDIISHDHACDVREQKYRMVIALCNMFGPENALCRVLNGLQHMMLTNIYENVQNELLSKNIRIVKANGKCLYLVKN